jgi:membrane protease YdiL (CAAX protease family)
MQQSTSITIPSTAAPAQRTPRVWGFWGTGGWALTAFLFWLAAQIGAVVLLLALRVGLNVDDWEFAKIDDATLITAATAIAAPFEIAVIWLAVRLARTPLRDYLALVRFTRRDFIVGFLVLTALGLIYDGTVWLMGRDVIPAVVINMYVSARDGGLLVPFIFVIAVVAPVTEEIVFRGFMYRGWSQSWLGVTGTILVTSALWALLHTQYDWDAVALIFGIGLAFGWLRWRSGSASLTIALHVMVNLGAMVQTAIKVEWLS